MKAASIILKRKENIWQNIVLQIFQKMQTGNLTITLPNGETIVTGNTAETLQADIRITRPEFFKKCVLYGDVGFGEAYVDGDWESTNITNLISWFLSNIDNAPTISGNKLNMFSVNVLKFFNINKHFFRSNTLNGSRKNISDHYDLNNDFFSLFLDETMTYSSAYFKEDDMPLKEAQYAKYEALCRRVKLKSSDHVLEIGTGWGGNAIYMAGKYGCRVTTTTISEEQHKMACEKVNLAGLEDKVTVLLQDYRELKGSYDKIVSIEMLEAVGHNFLESYFMQCHHLLKKDGLLGLQVITCPDSRYESLRGNVDWIQKYIFPGSLLPSIAAINKAVNNTSDFTLVNLEEMGLHYAKTLRYWLESFNSNWHGINRLGFNDTFKRKWNYYMCYCEAAFLMRNINVMQMVYSRPNNLNM
ncbi:MAG: cyclopropane-fatty-acyl-phospholipid synthase family protein [Bacteroidota bacterium]|nr:cyclopropane-fatty-acyl-phospholipid synthase family protein [Bacteroidota bacterium]